MVSWDCVSCLALFNLMELLVMFGIDWSHEIACNVYRVLSHGIACHVWHSVASRDCVSCLPLFNLMELLVMFGIDWSHEIADQVWHSLISWVRLSSLA
jgi:hypothetical protein